MFKMGTETSERVRVSWLVMIKLFSEEYTSESVYKKSTSQFFFIHLPSTNSRLDPVRSRRPYTLCHIPSKIKH